MTGILVIPGIVVLAASFFVAAAGAVAFRTRRTGMAVAFHGVSHTLGVLAALFVQIAIIPRFKKVFEDFGTQLPFVAELSIRMSDLVVSFALIVVAGAFVALGLDIAAFRHLRNEPSQETARIYTAATTLCLVGIVVTPVLAMVLPLIKLLNDLS